MGVGRWKPVPLPTYASYAMRVKTTLGCRIDTSIRIGVYKSNTSALNRLLNRGWGRVPWSRPTHPSRFIPHNR